MRRRKKVIGGILAGCAMMVIILDTKTALLGAQGGLQLCIQTVIPSLFPFLLLSGVIKNSLLGLSISSLRPIGKICKIPAGSESLLAIGMLAGYPAGAQIVADAYKDDELPLPAARRMLGFCSNAGPAFLFGILSPLFENKGAVWLLWGIHIISALIVGCLLPENGGADCVIEQDNSVTLPQALEKAVKTMAIICGWVITFRIILAFCTRWFLWRFPIAVQVLFSGFLELSNGCILLKELPNDGIRFVIAGAMLAFGGLCVCMQTTSVTATTGTGFYFPGKILQMFISILLCCLLQPVVMPSTQVFVLPASAFFILLLLTAICIHLIRGKKVVAFGKRMLYNTGISH